MATLSPQTSWQWCNLHEEAGGIHQPRHYNVRVHLQHPSWVHNNKDNAISLHVMHALHADRSIESTHATREANSGAPQQIAIVE